MNFSVTSPALPTIDLIAKIETTLTGMTTEEADSIRADLSSIIRKAKPPKRNITRKQSISLKSLQQNENIIILPADKGRATVVLDKEDYIKKCNKHLTSGPHTKLKKDPTSSIVSNVTKKLIELRDNNLIEQQEYFKLKPTGTQPPRFYGLPKIHKDGTPMRPIVSFTGTPLYEISKYIANILRPYGKLKEQHTSSSKYFSTFICQQKIEPDEIMVSFDVTSPYTTIPIGQALLIIRDLLEHGQKLTDKTLLSPRQILDLLDILLRTTYFKINGDFYQKTDGAAMGGPTSALFPLSSFSYRAVLLNYFWELCHSCFLCQHYFSFFQYSGFGIIFASSPFSIFVSPENIMFVTFESLFSLPSWHKFSCDKFCLKKNV